MTELKYNVVGEFDPDGRQPIMEPNDTPELLAWMGGLDIMEDYLHNIIEDLQICHVSEDRARSEAQKLNMHAYRITVKIERL
jgi:hypothetical protein